METPIRKVFVYSDGGLTLTHLAPAFRLAWDDQNPDYDYKCRTQSEGFVGPDNPPAVMRFYPERREKAGDFRVDLEDPYDWRNAIIAMNGGDVQKFDYLVGPSRAQFNTTGWPQMAYAGMSGNAINVLERVGEWMRFETLRQSDVDRVRVMTIQTHPQYIHRFTCVSWKNGQTVRINSTGTPRGDVFYPLITKDGHGWIPARHVVQLAT